MSELGRADPAAQDITRSLLRSWRAELAAGVRAMRADGSSELQLDPDRYAGALIAAIQGGVAILLATGSSTDLESALDLLLEPLRPGGSPPAPDSETDRCERSVRPFTVGESAVADSRSIVLT